MEAFILSIIIYLFGCTIMSLVLSTSLVPAIILSLLWGIISHYLAKKLI